MRCLLSVFRLSFALHFCGPINTCTGLTQGAHYSRRRLADAEAPYVVTVPGVNFEGMAQSINSFQTNYMEVSRRLGVPADEVSFCITYARLPVRGAM